MQLVYVILRAITNLPYKASNYWNKVKYKTYNSKVTISAITLFQRIINFCLRWVPSANTVSGGIQSLGLKPSTFSLRSERWNNYGLVTPRSVLFLLYLKQDQMIDRIVKTTSVFIYLTIMGAAMLNMFHLPLSSWRHSFYHYAPRLGARHSPAANFYWFVLLNY